jgi:hypothetical protein
VIAWYRQVIPVLGRRYSAIRPAISTWLVQFRMLLPIWLAVEWLSLWQAQFPLLLRSRQRLRQFQSFLRSAAILSNPVLWPPQPARRKYHRNKLPVYCAGVKAA